MRRHDLDHGDMVSVSVSGVLFIVVVAFMLFLWKQVVVVVKGS